MSNSTVDIQGQLLTMDNLIQGLNFLYEELSSRKEKLLSNEIIRGELKDIVNDGDFIDRVSTYIVDDALAQMIANRVMGEIDNDIEAFLENRIDKYLESKLQK